MYLAKMLFSLAAVVAVIALTIIGCTAQVEAPVDTGSSPAAKSTTTTPHEAPSANVSTEMSIGGHIPDSGIWY